MGTTLTGTTPQDTYDSLIKVTDNGPLSGTAKYLSDGLGNDSVLALSTSAIAIGTNTALAARLVTARGRVAISNASGANDSQLALYADGTTNGIYSTYNSTGSYLPMAFYTSDVERMRITAAGNVGIGTSSVSFDTGSGLRIERSGDSTIRLVGSGAAAEMTMTANGYQIDSRNGYIRFLTGAATGSATERVRILADGGLTFNGDTAQANALDDYEEGTWTMGVSFGGASVGVTYSNNTGTYTKIGRQVTVNGYILLSSKGSSTGEARITGLPFTIPNSIPNYSAANIYGNRITFANQLQGNGEINSTTIELWEITEAGVVTSLTDSDFVNNTGFILSFTYFV